MWKVSCAICGNAKSRRETWFTVTEDRDLDRLMVWRWNSGFARDRHAHNVCGRRHLREFIVHWMTTGCLHYPFAMDPRNRTTGTSTSELNTDWDVHPHQLAEITVDRGSIQRVLAENPLSLSVIFDELMIALEGESADDELCRFDEAEFAIGGF
jgi:hypothetical protein